MENNFNCFNKNNLLYLGLFIVIIIVIVYFCFRKSSTENYDKPYNVVVNEKENEITIFRTNVCEVHFDKHKKFIQCPCTGFCPGQTGISNGIKCIPDYNRCSKELVKNLPGVIGGRPVLNFSDGDQWRCPSFNEYGELERCSEQKICRNGKACFYYGN